MHNFVKDYNGLKRVCCYVFRLLIPFYYINNNIIPRRSLFKCFA